MNTNETTQYLYNATSPEFRKQASKYTSKSVGVVIGFGIVFMWFMVISEFAFVALDICCGYHQRPVYETTLETVIIVQSLVFLYSFRKTRRLFLSLKASPERCT